MACFSEIQRILRGEIPVDLTGRDLIYSRQGSQGSRRLDYERHSWFIATGFVASVNLKAGNHLEGSAVVVRIVWFWCVREVGQARAEVLDLPCLTDGG